MVQPQRRHQRATCSIEEAAALLGIGRNLAYRLAHERQLPAIRCGRRLLIPRAALERLLHEAGTPATALAAPLSDLRLDTASSNHRPQRPEGV
jgi:excisionase family DNA binding protein